MPSWDKAARDALVFLSASQGMAESRLEAVRTPCTPEKMFYALGYAWVQLFDEQPKEGSLLCLLSQWALEGDWGKSTWCRNIGNFKSREGDGRDWCMYECDERLDPATAQKYVEGAQPRADASGKPNAAYRFLNEDGSPKANKDGTVTVYFWPDHPVTRFRAYSTLQDGAHDYVESLFNRFSKAWPAIIAGDPDQFVHQLKVQGYFTADEATYTKTVHSLFNSFKGKKFSMADLPIMSEAHADQIMGLVALTMSNSIRDTEPAGPPTDEDPEKNV